ncbi:MAG: RNA-binding cell elongation regulator Jag/EloR [Methylocystaceae bacterium]
MEIAVVKKAKTVDEAVKAALVELEASIEEVEIEILEEPNKGILGIGKRMATVQVKLNRSPQKVVKEKLDKIFRAMGIDVQVGSLATEDNIIKANIIGNDVGLIIGRKGETLDALQLVTGLMTNHQAETRVRVVLDVEGYRAKREESLKGMALKMADKVKKSRKSVAMRPMSPQERRIVHTVLQNDPQVVTYSQGEEPNRKVIIGLKK